MLECLASGYPKGRYMRFRSNFLANVALVVIAVAVAFALSACGFATRSATPAAGSSPGFCKGSERITAPALGDVPPGSSSTSFGGKDDCLNSGKYAWVFPVEADGETLTYPKTGSTPVIEGGGMPINWQVTVPLVSTDTAVVIVEGDAACFEFLHQVSTVTKRDATANGCTISINSLLSWGQ
jgi:hypothetical protein